MSIVHQRLLDILEFAKSSASLRASPISELRRYSNLLQTDEALQALPGIHLDEEDDQWIVINRLQESTPKEPESLLLKAWLVPSKVPTRAPALRTHVEQSTLIAESLMEAPAEETADDKERLVALTDYPRADEVKSLHDAYINTIWAPWATEEKRRRATIKLYAELYTLRQQLQGDIVDTQVELVVGIGMVLWKHEQGVIEHPILTQGVDIELDQETRDIIITPRQIEPVIELQIFEGIDNPDLSRISEEARAFWADKGAAVSPFEQESFAPILKSAVTYIDPKAQAWPPAESDLFSLALPKPSEQAIVTNTWALFARPRGKNSFILDLQRFENKLKDSPDLILPAALAAIVTDPSKETVLPDYPSFRGLSVVSGSTGQDKPLELYFPLPFNDDQVRIAQLLECFDGVAVQGPPGTGKSHTIANIACHYLALGKRVLITSMKEPALTVVKEKMPADIQPLIISMLSNEKDGMRQFEYAITKMASEIQTIDPRGLGKEIGQLEDELDALHGALAHIDHQIAQWGKHNLTAIVLDEQKLMPQEAALEALKHLDDAAWVPDAITIAADCHPQMGNTDMAALRQARAELGADIDYLDADVPELHGFPSAAELLAAHKDLVSYADLQEAIDVGDVLAIAGSSQAIYEQAQSIAENLSNLGIQRERRNALSSDACRTLVAAARQGLGQPLLGLVETLRDELTAEWEKRSDFLSRPVAIDPEIERDAALVEAITNQAEGKRPFGLLGGMTRSSEIKKLSTVAVLGLPASEPADWAHVMSYIAHRKALRGFVLRWNALAVELMTPVLADAPESAGACMQAFEALWVEQAIQAMEADLVPRIAQLFPQWQGNSAFLSDDTERQTIQAAILHHLNHHRLSATWSVRQQCEQALAGRSGRVVDDLQVFFDTQLGSPEVSEAAMQSQWSALTNELLRVHNLKSRLVTVRRVTRLIEQSGASQLAARLRTVGTEGIGTEIPDNWWTCWRARRLQTYLTSLDARHILRSLGEQRRVNEHRLSVVYQEIVSKRTWLRLTENANPEVRSALVAFAAAVKGIGTGKLGKRAMRYQQDARRVADRANQAIPCWIMPHYRISETMPHDFGYFDLVIIDEASQSDLSALPALLRAKKILVVGDERQVSPEGVGLEEEKIRTLIARYLSSQVDIFRGQMTPDRSMYDLFKVVFQQATVTLKEHFRCVPAIIEYSKREFYQNDLRPLRLPRQSERLDPPLIDVRVVNGYRQRDVNKAEAHYILDKIQDIISDPAMSRRSIGVVSLTGNKQSSLVWELIEKHIPFELIERHQIACGDARTFQGKERDIMFLSMMVSPGEATALSGAMYEQRFNVAASRARDRMYLVRSIDLEQLSPADKLRRSLINHFGNPFGRDENAVKDLRALCESPMEEAFYDLLTERGYRVTPQVPVDRFRIDMVVEGENDQRLAIECDGDRFHGPDKWEDDMRRQRILERAGWQFWRCFASTFVLHREEVIEDLLTMLRSKGIEPSSDTSATLTHSGTETYVFGAMPGTEANIEAEAEAQ